MQKPYYSGVFFFHQRADWKIVHEWRNSWWWSFLDSVSSLFPGFTQLCVYTLVKCSEPGGGGCVVLMRWKAVFAEAFVLFWSGAAREVCKQTCTQKKKENLLAEVHVFLPALKAKAGECIPGYRIISFTQTQKQRAKKKSKHWFFIKEKKEK